MFCGKTGQFDSWKHVAGWGVAGFAAAAAADGSVVGASAVIALIDADRYGRRFGAVA